MKTVLRTKTKITPFSCLSWIFFNVSVTALYFIVSSTIACAGQANWDKSTEPAVVGYKIYYGTATRNYTQSVKITSPNITICTIINLLDGQKYYFAATTYNAELIESDYSAEVSCTITSATTTVPTTTTTVQPTTSSTSSNTSSIQQTTTTSTSGSLILTKPNGGESWNRNSMRSITWSTSGSLGTLKLTLWQNGALIGPIADGLNPAEGSYSWTVGAYNGSTAPLGTGYKIRIEDNSSALADESNGTFSIVKVKVNAPNGGESWQIGSTQNITWLTKIISNNMRIVLFKNGAKVGNIVESIDPALGTYAWPVGSYVGGTVAAGTGYQVQVREIGTDAGDRSDANITLTAP